MLKNFLKSLRNSIHPAADASYCANNNKDTLLQLAYAWTQDTQQAKQLASSILAKTCTDQLNDHRQARLLLCSNLFKCWCLNFDSEFNPQARPWQGEGEIPDAEFYQQCVSSLPKFQRVIITLVDIAGLSYHDVSCIVNIEEQKIKSWISAARKSILQQAHMRVCQIS